MIGFKSCYSVLAVSEVIMSMSFDEKAVFMDADPVVDSFVRPPFSRLRVQVVPVGDSLTLQSEASACDINEIIARYDQSGFLPAARMEPQYGDVSELNGDFGELLNKSMAALSAFNAAKAEFELRKSADAKKLMDEKEADYQRLKELEAKSQLPS